MRPTIVGDDVENHQGTDPIISEIVEYRKGDCATLIKHHETRKQKKRYQQPGMAEKAKMNRIKGVS